MTRIPPTSTGRPVSPSDSRSGWSGEGGVAVDPQTADLILAVEDTGIGIADDQLTRIFDKFTQADSSTTRRYGGTGLGLAICRQLTELMGGALRVTSRPGYGSRFEVALRLPLASPPPAAASAAPAPAGAGAQRQDSAVSDLAGVRVLVADGNRVTRTILREQLESWGMRVACHARGANALSALSKAASEGDGYRVALLDVNLSDLDAATFAGAVRADARLAPTALLLLAPMHQARHAAAVAASGFRATVTKPVCPSQLQDALLHTLLTAPDDGERAAAAPPPKPATLPPYGRAAADPKGRVLVVEDNRINQEVSRSILARFGCAVDVAADGRDALDRLAERRYDVILLDCQMPGMDGFETAREIRRREQLALPLLPPGAPPSAAALPHPRVPIVAMTADLAAGIREQCLAAGMDEYLPKPVSPDRLRAVVAHYLPVPAAMRGLTEADAETRRFAARAFREDSPALLAAVRDALDARDRPAVARAAHALKGVLMHFRADRAVAAARDLEAAATGADPDMSDLHALWADLEREVSALARTLEAHEAVNAAELSPVGASAP